MDGLTSFENSLVMSVDFVTPRAHQGKKEPTNLVAACRPCNLIKGRRFSPASKRLGRTYFTAAPNSIRSGNPDWLDYDARPQIVQDKEVTEVLRADKAI